MEGVKHLIVYADLTWGLNDIFQKDFDTITFGMYPILSERRFRICVLGIDMNQKAIPDKDSLFLLKDYYGNKLFFITWGNHSQTKLHFILYY